MHLIPQIMEHYTAGAQQRELCRVEAHVHNKYNSQRKPLLDIYLKWHLDKLFPSEVATLDNKKDEKYGTFCPIKQSSMSSNLQFWWNDVKIRKLNFPPFL